MRIHANALKRGLESCLAGLAAMLCAAAPARAGDTGADRPNILWITSEDISPYLGCYGFNHAQTPNLDAPAAIDRAAEFYVGTGGAVGNGGSREYPRTHAKPSTALVFQHA